MRLKIIFTLFIIICGIVIQAKQLQQGFNKKEFYEVLKADDLNKINKEIDLVVATSILEKEAYEGALLMKKAGLVNAPINKLKFFKEGRSKLEAAIRSNNQNTEFRFLRLIIQENAPKIVNYRADIKTDCAHIRTHFTQLTAVVQQEVMEYSKTSKNLIIGDF